MIRVYHHIWPFGTPNNIGLKIAEEQRERLVNQITDKFTYHPNIVNINENECHTFLKILEEVKEFDNTDYILYIHTKGASKPTKLYEIEWRKYMESSLIDNYKEHIKLLNMGFDTSGVLMRIDNYMEKYPDIIKYFGYNNFYSGNFWWTTVKSINRIPKYIKNMWGTLENRYFGETYFINQIDEWNPAVLYPPLDNFKNFYNYVKLTNDHLNPNLNGKIKNII
jgi:hypothetical protein